MKKKILLKEQKELNELNRILLDKHMQYYAFEKLRVSSLNSLYIACDPKYKKKRDEKTPLFCIKPLPYEEKKDRQIINKLFNIYALFPNEDVIIKTVGNFESKWNGTKHIFLIYKYYPYPDLFDYFFEEDEKDITEKCNVTYQMLQILKLLKERNVLHNDIKLENFIIMQKNPLKIGIIDFDFAEIIKTKTNIMSGTESYYPPEFFIKNERSFPSDMWSLGMCVYMILYNYSPFDFGKKPTFESVRKALMKYDVYIPEDVDDKKDKAWLCVSAMLDKNPATRITPEKALKMGWFKSITIIQRTQVNKDGIKAITKSIVTDIYNQAQSEDPGLLDLSLEVKKHDDNDDDDSKHKKIDDDDDDNDDYHFY